MKMIRFTLGAGLAVVMILLTSQPSEAAPLSTAFTYQGRLMDGGQPANGFYDFTFKLYDALAGGSTVGNPMPGLAAVPVTNGLFTVTLDFGLLGFDGADRWLQIVVKTNGAAISTFLSPRQPLTPTPYALYAARAESASSVSSVPWSSLTGIPAGFADGVDNDTTYSAGVGLTLSPDRAFALGTVPLDRISTVGASAGQSLTFNGSAAQWAVPSLTLSLPYAGSVASGGASFFVSNDDVGPAAVGSAIFGSHASTGAGIQGSSVSGIGVRGSHTSATGRAAGVAGITLSAQDNASGVLGTVSSDSPGALSAGVRGVNNGTGGLGVGVAGTHAGGGYGVYGVSPDGHGIHGNSLNGTGVYGAGALNGVEASKPSFTTPYFIRWSILSVR